MRDLSQWVTNERPKRQVTNERPKKRVTNERRKKRVTNERRKKRVTNERRKKRVTNERRKKRVTNERRKKRVTNERPKKPVTSHSPEVDEVAEVWRGVRLVAGAVFNGGVEGALTQECLGVGRHVWEVVHDDKHLHHRLVGVEESLQAAGVRL